MVKHIKFMSALIALVLTLGVMSAARPHHSSTTSAHVLGEQLVRAQSNGSSTNDKSSSKFDATGSVDELYPGGSRPLTITLTNSTGAAIKVTRLTVAVGDASADCLSTNLQVGQFDGPVTVPKKGTAATVIQLSMVRDAPNACQGMNFPLTYTGDASPA